MKLSADPQRGQNLITGYTAGEVKLAERTLVTSAIVMADRIVDWTVAGVDTLNEAALDAILDLEPELVLLATGERQQFPAPALLAYLPGRGVGLEVMHTGAACRTYNVLVAEDRRVALALVLG